jgi:nicotinamidase-related amidase
MSDTAVLVVDMMNRYQHPVADVLVPDVGKIIEPMADLARRACEFDGEPCPTQRYSGCERV